MKSSPALLTILGLATALAHAQPYTVIDISPDNSVEASIGAYGSGAAVGTASFLLPDAPFPDAREVLAFAYDTTTGTTNLLDTGPDFSGAFAFGAGGSQVVGFGFTSGPNIALLWDAPTSTAIQLNSAATISAVASGTDGFTQVGSAITTTSFGESRAWAWNGTAASGRALAFVDGFNASVATTIRDGRIVGTGDDADFFQAGLYWANADAQAVVVRPQGFEETRLADVDGDWVLGSGYGDPTGFQRHAYLWNVNDIENGIALHPTDPLYTFSEATALLAANDTFTGGIQVGFVAFENDSFEFIEQAGVWFGSAESFINLHALVEAEFGASFRFSKAEGVDEFGNIYGTAFDGLGNSRAVQWRVVPTPGVLALAAPLGLLASRRRR